MIVACDIQKDRMLCDGTPRREKGYRAYVTTKGPDLCPHFYAYLGILQKRVYVSPIFQRREDAEAWLPEAVQ
jgi:hypothetical protein